MYGQHHISHSNGDDVCKRGANIKRPTYVPKKKKKKALDKKEIHQFSAPISADFSLLVAFAPLLFSRLVSSLLLVLLAAHVISHLSAQRQGNLLLALLGTKNGVVVENLVALNGNVDERALITTAAKDLVIVKNLVALDGQVDERALATAAENFVIVKNLVALDGQVDERALIATLAQNFVVGENAEALNGHVDERALITTLAQNFVVGENAEALNGHVDERALITTLAKNLVVVEDVVALNGQVDELALAAGNVDVCVDVDQAGLLGGRSGGVTGDVGVGAGRDEAGVAAGVVRGTAVLHPARLDVVGRGGRRRARGKGAAGRSSGS
ncbi:hypothetical protein IWX90DRAFT_195158 [Phyllosticta citrichinensis]|uniref:Uncharacterized protein n=1 Tax=Phyllosticta citrichinensis TaxID=1130410 RepID=A0ABR1XX51_9PEZI